MLGLSVKHKQCLAGKDNASAKTVITERINAFYKTNTFMFSPVISQVYPLGQFQLAVKNRNGKSLMVNVCSAYITYTTLHNSTLAHVILLYYEPLTSATLRNSEILVMRVRNFL